jgi:hypothetical protein
MVIFLVYNRRCNSGLGKTGEMGGKNWQRANLPRVYSAQDFLKRVRGFPNLTKVLKFFPFKFSQVIMAIVTILAGPTKYPVRAISLLSSFVGVGCG